MTMFNVWYSGGKIVRMEGKADRSVAGAAIARKQRARATS
jgi:hypothetical protein